MGQKIQGCPEEQTGNHLLPIKETLLFLEFTLMKYYSRISTALALILLGSTASLAGHHMEKAAMKSEKTVMVGGAAMYPSKNIIENAANSKDHTTLVAAVKAAGLVKTLSGKGPFTVFAPTNAAFAKLPKGTVATLLKPENKKMLVKILTSHVVGTRALAQTVKKMIADDKGKHTITTLSGAKLVAWQKDGHIYLTDEKGGKAKVTIADVLQSNGLIHVIDSVLLPN